MILVVISSILVGCKTDNGMKHAHAEDHKGELEKELASLSTDELKKEYLEEIMFDDQKVRGPEGQELMLKYGRDSREHMNYVRAQWRQDSINLLKIERYFDLYGYPHKSLGINATTAPWMVLHHSQEYSTREDNFEIIYKAFLDGHIDDGDITFFLGRMYSMKYGKMLDMENPFSADDELDKLISGLELESKRKKIDDQYKR